MLGQFTEEMNFNGKKINCKKKVKMGGFAENPPSVGLDSSFELWVETWHRACCLS
jgi:hypothetical protein